MQGIPHLDSDELRELARRALAEDLGEVGDITSKRIVRIDQPGRAHILAKEKGILAGVPVAEEVFRLVDRSLQIEWLVKDSGELKPGTTIANIQGRARAILAAERVALNFLQQLSGVATLTERYAEICAKHGVRLLCTRKTVPGMRAVQRYAVAIGAGHLHRAGLYDAILIKNNHEVLAGGITEAVKRTKANPNLEAEVEVADIQELQEAIEAGADRILLDNAKPKVIAQAVKKTRGKIFLEVSGGIDLETIAEIAALQPDAISVGRITHSAPALDMALHVLGPTGVAPRH